MYEDKTQSVIRAAILAAMGDSVSKLEGSFASDMAAAVALEIATAYAHIDYALLTYLLETNEGEYLERRAAEYGITRKSGTKATVTLTAAGTNGTVLPANTQVLSEDGHVFLTDAAATVAGGVATVQATAAKIGAEYNVIAGSVTRFFKNIAGISSIANENAAVGGTDNESDEALRERVLFRLQMPATSGNAYHYQQWALEAYLATDANKRADRVLHMRHCRMAGHRLLSKSRMDGSVCLHDHIQCSRENPDDRRGQRVFPVGVLLLRSERIRGS
jgi:uncharacterized phage protein gp47/JayE